MLAVGAPSGGLGPHIEPKSESTQSSGQFIYLLVIKRKNTCSVLAVLNCQFDCIFHCSLAGLPLFQGHCYSDKIRITLFENNIYFNQNINIKFSFQFLKHFAFFVDQDLPHELIAQNIGNLELMEFLCYLVYFLG